MFYKSVALNIFCCKIPCELVILSSDNKIIKKLTIKTFKSKICLCTKECKIKILARYKNQIIYQSIRIDSCCKNINIVFNKCISQSLCLINLFDANYFFPIADAILNFKQVIYKYLL